MTKCAFCSKECKIGKGVTFVKDSGAVLHFCSSKCRKNMNLGRKARKLKWSRKKKV